MPTVKTLAIAATVADGGVIIHHIVCDTKPTPGEIASSLARAGFGNCRECAIIDAVALPSREHRGAWVLKDGAVVVDPSRMKIAAALEAVPTPDEPRRIVFNGSVFAAPDHQRLSLAVGLANTAISAGGLAGDLRWHGGKTDFSWPDVDGKPVAMDAPTLIKFARTAYLT